MTSSRLTVNCLPQYVADFGKLLTFLRSLDPVSVVVGIDSMNALNRVLELQQALPQAKIIGRYIFSNDGAMHLRPQAADDMRKYIVSPLDALNAWGDLGRAGRMLYLHNEPLANGAQQDDIARLVEWTLEAISLASERNISLCVLNFGVGHPELMGNGEYDARFDDVLTALSKNRETMVLGMHVYQPADTFTRLDGLIKRCKTLGIKPPRVHITEAGFDAGSGGDSLNGYKSRGYSGQQFAAFQIDKIKNVYHSYFVDDILQSVATFVWGGESSWHAFDVETDTDWQATVLDAASKGLLSATSTPPTVIPQPVKPAYQPSAFVAGEKYTLQSKGGERTNVHSSPLVAVDNKLALIEDKTVATILEVKQVGIDWWYHISLEAPAIKDGWVSGRGGELTWVPYLEQPTPVIVPPSVPYPEVSAVYARQMAQVYKSLAETYELMTKSTMDTSNQWAALASVIDGDSVPKAA